MLVSCLCVCHNKPDVTPEAIRSLLNQTYPHWEAIVVDSGVLYDAGYYNQFDWRTDRRIRLIRSPETDETRRTRAMAPWCFNECFRRGWVKGDLVTYLCDDDVFYPNAFETFVSYCRNHPEAQAMYASQDIGVIYPNGRRAIVGERRAARIGGRCCGGRTMDCEVDYLQFCHKKDVLTLLSDDEYWPESKATEGHADGLFMERVGDRVPIHAIDVKVSQNRRTPHSTYRPLLEELIRENQELRARLGLLRYRIADRLDVLLARVPFVRGALKRLIQALGRRRAQGIAGVGQETSSSAVSTG